MVFLSVERDNKPIGEEAVKGSWIRIYPKGLQDLLSYMNKKYDNPVILITENGTYELEFITTINFTFLLKSRFVYI